MRHDPSPSITTACPALEGLTAAALGHVAAYFQALSEPTRLQILNLLRGGERNVGELAQDTGYTSANISRHLAQLMQHGLVARQGRGTAVYYRIADDSVYALCDLVCGNIARRLERTAGEHQAFLQGGAAAPKHAAKATAQAPAKTAARSARPAAGRTGKAPPAAPARRR